MRSLAFHLLGIAGAFLAGFAVVEFVDGTSSFLASAAETAAGVGVMWLALAALS